MAVDVTDVANAIVAALNDDANNAEFTEEFNAVVAYSFIKPFSEYKIEDPPDVIVIPRKEENKKDGRGFYRFDFGIGIAVVRKTSDTETETITPLLDFARSVRDFLMDKDMAGCEYDNVSMEVLYGHDELYQDSALVSTIGADYWIEQ